jgi:exodeoxyribonuclease V alpha subunit
MTGNIRLPFVERGSGNSGAGGLRRGRPRARAASTLRRIKATRPKGNSDFYFVPADAPWIAAARIVELVKTRIPQRVGLDPIRDILCPMNRGGIGAR